jgi:hypothetical protein
LGRSNRAPSSTTPAHRLRRIDHGRLEFRDSIGLQGPPGFAGRKPVLHLSRLAGQGAAIAMNREASTEDAFEYRERQCHGNLDS